MIKLTITIETTAGKGTSAVINREGTPYTGGDENSNRIVNNLENSMAILYEKVVTEKQREIYQKATCGKLAEVISEAVEYVRPPEVEKKVEDAPAPKKTRKPRKKKKVEE